MIGLLIAGASSFFSEVGSSIGKYQIQKHKASIFTVGFLNMLLGAAILIIVGLTRTKGLIFSFASFPFFGIRVILEVVQTHISLKALAKAERSALCFIRTLTIPLLLLVDVVLGYTIGLNQILGITIIIGTLIFLLINHGFKKEGVFFALFTAVNAVATISLYKYDISHFNSVEAEQGIVMIILMIYLFAMSYFWERENPLSFFKKPIFAFESLAEGLASAIVSFAYLFAPASIIVAASRSFDVLWGMISGRTYFHEKHFLVKLISFILIVGGLAFLAF